MEEIVIVAAKRTPFGAFGGSFKGISATELAVVASKAALAQAPGSAEHIGHVIYGNVLQTSADALYLARHVGLKSGIDRAVPAVTVNRLCGSGFESIVQGARLLSTGEARAVLVGGTESMSQAPYVLRGARFGYRLGNSELEDSLMAGLTDPIPQMPMAITAENLAVQYGISREQCDAFALQSQQKTQAAREKNLFQSELTPVDTPSKGKPTTVDADEHPRPQTTLEALAKLKPVFKKQGVVTAGNASGMVDGAASLVLTTARVAKSEGWEILGTVLGSQVVGCDPAVMGIGPVPATRAVLEKTGLKLAQMDLVEVNEAFAAQTLSVAKELEIDPKRLNTHGGAIAIGHPLGASGARITAHLLYALKAQGGGLGLGTACIGGGQGIAIVLKA